ncbi:MAG TPA: hypothetical protein VFI24_20285 [Pyrinomonadaceae bacterium]|nr:hypothetical protein [Pyrinomonadaceae bacterium]
MKIEPNHTVDFRQECVLCEEGKVFLFDNSNTGIADLSAEDSSFRKFCQSLDPNRCFILALIPNDNDKEVFFEARQVADEVGLHIQATVDTPERHRALWENYKNMKQYPQPESDDQILTTE